MGTKKEEILVDFTPKEEENKEELPNVVNFTPVANDKVEFYPTESKFSPLRENDFIISGVSEYHQMKNSGKKSSGKKSKSPEDFEFQQSIQQSEDFGQSSTLSCKPPQAKK